ncbi:rRNA maturation RNase YbeY [Flagellimonas allohymeniacidonis]|uniref:Endoribonuclease YbeY n=1 Tax=Flagellimonas allohymeniacidonis TaxID=2517819 RepID=A0A4Q8QB99_9FLAO|nr:rRNA maturation RNase YbeY [Allomuricauda hymeniacidonis]TAI47561.1 rRNA maturation RNase YbeY [Allomuricauda hymeniacidonis]
MIEFHFESDFKLDDKTKYSDWVNRVIEGEGFRVGDVSYIFKDDDGLLRINQSYLNHDWYTDIITFDYVQGRVISGDIFISTERVNENAKEYQVDFEEELLRVMAHGLLHLMGFSDKDNDSSVVMREKEDEKIKLFHVER